MSQTLTFEAHDGLHRLVYIEYWEGRPHEAITERADYPGVASTWDIEPDQRVEGGYMYYESGGFGLAHRALDVQADEYWVAEDIRINSVAAHSKRLSAPLNVNLFAEGREVFDIVYCRVCDKFYDEDWCWEHQKEKKGGGVGYRKGFRKKDLAADNAAGVPTLAQEGPGRA